MTKSMADEESPERHVGPSGVTATASTWASTNLATVFSGVSFDSAAVIKSVPGLALVSRGSA